MKRKYTISKNEKYFDFSKKNVQFLNIQNTLTDEKFRLHRKKPSNIDKYDLIIDLLKQNSDFSSKVSDKYYKMVIEIMCGIGNNNLEKEDKIIHNISKCTTIEKYQEAK
jgi:hypothetical protein